MTTGHESDPFGDGWPATSESTFGRAGSQVEHLFSGGALVPIAEQPASGGLRWAEDIEPLVRGISVFGAVDELLVVPEEPAPEASPRPQVEPAAPAGRVSRFAAAGHGDDLLPVRGRQR